MPTYVYRFVDTGETIEVQQSFTDSSLTEAEHPATGAVMPVKKVYTPVGVTFRGSGFYKTDSRGKAKTSGANGSSGSGEKSDSGGGKSANDSSSRTKSESRASSSSEKSGSSSD